MRSLCRGIERHGEPCHLALASRVELAYYPRRAPFHRVQDRVDWRLECLVDFKEASFLQGKLIRISKKKVEVQVLDEESGEPALATMKLGEGVNVDLDVVGEDVKVVIVDGKVARITPLSGSTTSGSAKVTS